MTPDVPAGRRLGDLDLNYQSMELPSEPGLVLNVYTAPAGSPTADALRLLASHAATHDDVTAEPASRTSLENYGMPIPEA